MTKSDTGAGLHSALVGLIRELPPPGPWEKSRKEAFLLAFKLTLDVIYPNEEDEKRHAPEEDR